MEPDLGGGLFRGGGGDKWAQAPTMGTLSGSYKFKIPGVTESTKEVMELSKNLTTLLDTMTKWGQNSGANPFERRFQAIATSMKNMASGAKDAHAALRGGGGGSTGTGTFPVVTRSKVDAVATPASGGSGSGGGGGIPSFVTAPEAPDPNYPFSAYHRGKPAPPKAMGASAGGLAGSDGIANAFGNLVGAANPFGTGGAVKAIINTLKAGAELYGAIAQAGMQYTTNRIEGPAGNRNAMLSLSQALGPNATMMGMTLQDSAYGLTQRTPVQGSFTDIIQAILSGQQVGAYMRGTDNRSGFFEAVRQAQMLTPGVGAGQISSDISGYIGNTQSQKMGAFYTGGAFSMVGAGGSYKSLAEWAEGITNFLKQQRPGSKRGKEFTRDELLTQNFPGSNINAWFQMMGVPQSMVDYWWQFVMTKATDGGTSPWSGGDLQDAVNRQRGIDLSAERMTGQTAAARREFNLGAQMYGLYGAREASDRRFNNVMMHADTALGAMMSQTNAGALMSILPTPIAEILTPLLTKMVSSPAGGIASLVGGIFGDPIGDPGYGPVGGTTTSGLSPDLASKIQAMQRDNPLISITSGHRDEFLQGRLHSKGVGRVGPVSHSQHTKGNAADLGPRSQLPWIQANAHRYGLQTAAGAGEPWHVQRAGTMPHRFGDPSYANVGGIGDPLIGDWLSPAKSLAGGVADAVGGAIGWGWDKAKDLHGGLADAIFAPLTGGLDIFQEFLTRFTTGGSMGGMVDNAINLYAKMMMMPMTGLASLLGETPFGTSQVALRNYTTQSSPFSLTLPSWGGFKPPDALGRSSDTLFGDPLLYGSPTYGRVQPVNIQNTIIVSAPGGSSHRGLDTTRVAREIGDKLEAQLTRVHVGA